jgi:integrase
VRKRILGRPETVAVDGETVPGVGAVARANKQLETNGLAPLPEGLTLHSLRRTFASLLIAIGKDPAYVMSQMDAPIRLSRPPVRQGDERRGDDRERLRALVEGDHLALAGTGPPSGTPARAGAAHVDAENPC